MVPWARYWFESQLTGFILLVFPYDAHSCGSRTKIPPGLSDEKTLRKKALIPSSPSFKWIHFVIEKLFPWEISCIHRVRLHTYAITTSYPCRSSTAPSFSQSDVLKLTLCGNRYLEGESAVTEGIGSGPNICSNAAGKWSCGYGGPRLSSSTFLFFDGSLWLSTVSDCEGPCWLHRERLLRHAARIRKSSISTPITSWAPHNCAKRRTYSESLD